MLLCGHTSSLKKKWSGSMVNSWCLQFFDVTMLLQVVLADTIDERARIEVFVNPITFLAPTRFRFLCCHPGVMGVFCIRNNNCKGTCYYSYSANQSFELVTVSFAK